MLPRPRFRLPLAAVPIIAAVAYVLRAIIKGLDFSPDLPLDALILGMLLVVMGMVALTRAEQTRENALGHSDSEPEREDRETAPHEH